MPHSRHQRDIVVVSKISVLWMLRHRTNMSHMKQFCALLVRWTDEHMVFRVPLQANYKITMFSIPSVTLIFMLDLETKVRSTKAEETLPTERTLVTKRRQERESRKRELRTQDRCKYRLFFFFFWSKQCSGGGAGPLFWEPVRQGWLPRAIGSPHVCPGNKATQKEGHSATVQCMLGIKE